MMVEQEFNDDDDEKNEQTELIIFNIDEFEFIQ